MKTTYHLGLNDTSSSRQIFEKLRILNLTRCSYRILVPLKGQSNRYALHFKVLELGFKAYLDLKKNKLPSCQ